MISILIRNIKMAVIISTTFLTSLILYPEPSYAARIKDIANIKGVRENQLFGYGLVIGLAGTGDSNSNIPFITQSVVSMLSHMGVSIPPSDLTNLKVKNIATVVVTGDLPPFSKPGNKIDVTVSSIGDAKSLKGGILLFTPLKGADGMVYVIAQGSISISEVSEKKGEASSHLTVGKISSGGIVEKDIRFDMNDKSQLALSLRQPDFTTAFRLAEAVNSKFKEEISRSSDASNVYIKIPLKYRNNEVAFISMIEDIIVSPDQPAKVVIDERTGTVVIGRDVVLSKVAISHGSISVEVKIKQAEPEEVASPAAGIRRRRSAGQEAPKGKVLLLEEGANIDELVNALNAVGVLPSDLITIFQSLKAAGALQAELEIV